MDKKQLKELREEAMMDEAIASAELAGAKSMDNKKFKPITEMSTAELKDWKLWAQDEIREYQDFIQEIDEALNYK